MKGKMKGKMKGVLLIAVFILSTLAIAIPLVIAVSPYYVATDGSDEFGDGTETWVDNDSSEDWTTGDTGPWLTIQHAIDTVTATDEIIVAEGTYAERLTITKSLTLSGPNAAINPNTVTREPEAIIEFDIAAGVIEVKADTVTVKGFTIKNNLGEGFWIWYDTTAVTVQNNIITGVLGTGNGIMLTYDFHSGMDEKIVANALISQNKITGFWCGVLVMGCASGTEISGNVITGAMEGINLGGGKDSLKTTNTDIIGNTITDSAMYGISIETCFEDVSLVYFNDILIDDNIISGIPGNSIYIYTGLEIETLVTKAFPELDSDYYRIDDTVHVTVYAGEWNSDPMAQEEVWVWTGSACDTHGDIVSLTETDSDTGVFEGSFTLIDEPPADREADQIVVEEEDTLTVEYKADQVDDTDPYDIFTTAGVDMVSPVFVEVDPIVGLDFYKNGDTITLTVDLTETGYTLTADFSEIDSEYSILLVEVTDYVITYEISEDNTFADGEYTITVMAEDDAGNTETCDFTTTLDNTMPSVADGEADPTVIQPEEETDVTFTVSVSDLLSDGLLVTIDLSEIDGDAEQVMTEITEGDPPVGTGVYTVAEAPYTVALEGDYILPITATDDAGNENDLESITLQVILDTEVPTAVGFTEAVPVCGGLIVRGLYMEDELTGPGSYAILVDGVALETEEERLLETDLISTDYRVADDFDQFKRSVILQLTGYTVDPVNVTLIAYDLVGNDADEIILYEGLIPDGLWVPVMLFEGWNLVSLPLIPDSSDSGDILSLILEQGASGVVITYEYDQYNDVWISNPAEMTDGYGYWIYLLDDDFIIVEGIDKYPAPSSPQTYEYTEGWVLAGYKHLAEQYISDYVASLQDNSYFSTIYVWDAAAPVWDIKDASPAVDTLRPGMGFWMWMYSDQNLIAPLEYEEYVP